MIHQQRRRFVGWFCAVALALLALVAPLHGLAHAVQALQGVSDQDPAAAHAHACGQCLQFAALDDGAPAAPGVDVPQPGAMPAPATLPAPRPRATVFTAYASRAPPRHG